MSRINMNYEEAKKKVQQYGQEHVLRYYEELDKADQEELLKQIEETDMSVLSLCTHKEDLPEKGVITPLAAMQLDEIEAEKETYRNAGTKAVRDGKVGAVLLAGGMGTRLGSDDPKGMYKLYIYGSRKGIRSSRKLSESCKVNLEVKWMMGGVEPDFRTISDFRKDNIDSLKKISNFEADYKRTERYGRFKKENERRHE